VGRLPRDGLDHSEQIFGTMRQLPQQSSALRFMIVDCRLAAWSRFTQI
jgi:hypothetical protein